MDRLANRPLFTREFSPGQSLPTQGAFSYIYGRFEERSELAPGWLKTREGRLIEVVELDMASANFGPGFEDVRLRDAKRLQEFLRSIAGGPIFIDITGLTHRVWAPLLRAAVQAGIPIDVIYVEPEDYRYSASPREGEIFDLSERIDGIAPIPGFAFLSERRNRQTCFVPLLGFEGTRLAYLIEQVEPIGHKTFPIVGLPGFRPEYPFHSYLGNHQVLKESRAWKNIHYATANCPFSLYFALEEIIAKNPSDHIKVGLIGTKPHALGAVLYAVSQPDKIELVFDHPKPKIVRTTGAARRLCYSISMFMKERMSAALT